MKGPKIPAKILHRSIHFVHCVIVLPTLQGNHIMHEVHPCAQLVMARITASDTPSKRTKDKPARYSMCGSGQMVSACAPKPPADMGLNQALFRHEYCSVHQAYRLKPLDRGCTHVITKKHNHKKATSHVQQPDRSVAP